eukprot:3736773-Amphidinium_carterae.5
MYADVQQEVLKIHQAGKTWLSSSTLAPEGLVPMDVDSINALMMCADKDTKGKDKGKGRGQKGDGEDKDKGKSSGKGNESGKKKGNCQYCGKAGHYAAECRQKERDERGKQASASTETGEPGNSGAAPVSAFTVAQDELQAARIAARQAALGGCSGKENSRSIARKLRKLHIVLTTNGAMLTRNSHDKEVDSSRTLPLHWDRSLLSRVKGLPWSTQCDVKGSSSRAGVKRSAMSLGESAVERRTRVEEESLQSAPEQQQQQQN